MHCAPAFSSGLCVIDIPCLIIIMMMMMRIDSEILKFVSDLWQELWNMVRTVANSSMPSVSVTVGPLFDYDYDGHADDETNITRYTSTL